MKPEYKVGDKAPGGYVAWHTWARAQYKGGLRQSKCSKCGRLLFPQEVKDHKCKDGE